MILTVTVVTEITGHKTAQESINNTSEDDGMRYVERDKPLSKVLHYCCRV